MAQFTISAKVRRTTGKGPARKLRRNNQIPAIFYGRNAEPIMLTVNMSDLEGIMRQTRGENVILGLRIEPDRGRDTRRVMLKELQTNPIKNTFVHADFYEIIMDKELTIDVPIRFVNTPLGADQGGILQQIRRELTVSCLPDKLVEHIDVDVSSLDIGDSLHLSDIQFPEGIRTTQEGHLTVAVVAAPTISAEKPEEEEELEEVEEVETAAETESAEEE